MEIPTITNDTLYYQEYCTNFTWDSCIERTTILWVWKEELKQAGVEILTISLMFCGAVLFLIWFVKWVFRLIMPWKWRK